jgi:perosamine synthetase
MITTDSDELYERAKHLRDHAMSKSIKYWHTDIGFNYRMTNLQAALGLAQLERIDDLIHQKRQIFEWYRELLADLPNIALNPEGDAVKNVFWMVSLLVDGVEGRRHCLMDALRENGIDSRPFFYPISHMPMYKMENLNPVAAGISSRGLNLPSSVNLSKDDVSRICNAIRQALLA